MLVSKGLVVTGCDDGTVIAVRLLDGGRQWDARFDSAVVGGPLRLPANIGGGLAHQLEQQAKLEPVLVVTFEGHLCMLDLTSGHKIHALQLGEPVLGSPLLVKTNNRHIIVIPTLRGRLLFIEYINILIAFGRCRSATIDTAALGKQGKSTYNFELAAQPGWSGSLVLQGIVRKTYDKDPPLIAVDPISLAIRWIARAAADYQEHFGNLRSPPVVVDREAVLAPAYSSKVLAVSIDTGMMTWSVDLGQSLFEQWAGPIASGRSIFIARHDGYLHKISSEHRRREWSIYLGDESRAGAVVAAEQKPPEFADSQAWTAGASSPILATPALDRGRIYVGTHQGWLYCISNLGDDMRSALHQ